MRLGIHISTLCVAACILSANAGTPAVAVLIGRSKSSSSPKHLREPPSEELLRIVDTAFVLEAESSSKAVVETPTAIAPAAVSDKPEARYQVFDNGYCEVNHPWTPGDHGCAYVRSAEDCTTAAIALGLEPDPSRRNVSLATRKGNTSVVPFYRAPPSMSFVQPRGCLTGIQESSNAAGAAVVFATGYGTARCGEDGLSCICDCKERRPVGGQDIDDLEPEHVALLLAGSSVFIAIVFICGHVSRGILSGSWVLVGLSMI